MNVLWITNTIFPTVCKELKLPTPVVGGWMYSSASHLCEKFNNINLAVASIYQGKELKILKDDNITYYLLPGTAPKHLYDNSQESYWTQVANSFQPDVVHIHGSEYPHGLSYVNACGNKNVVVSVQGLVSVYHRYYMGGIPETTLHKSVTIRDRFRKDSLFHQQSRMKNRARFEIQLFKKINHVIGRTSWDKVHSWAINPTIKYHFCNETLRNGFYQHSWDINNCEKNSIFLSQAHYPIKGLQQLIKALPYVLNEFPQTKVYVAGNNFFSGIGKWKINGYAKYIHSLIKSLKVSGKIVFTGILSENEMRNKYLNAHVFVCPSSIENSPNSVGEAQLLGVPCISSYVGGVSDMIKHGETGFVYRYSEHEMLAKYICNIFKDDILAKTISTNSQITAKKRHSAEINTQKLYSIYNEILNHAKNSNIYI